jgi:hypothetical protein
MALVATAFRSLCLDSNSEARRIVAEKIRDGILLCLDSNSEARRIAIGN